MFSGIVSLYRCSPCSSIVSTTSYLGIIKPALGVSAVQSSVCYYFSLWPVIADASWEQSEIKKSIYFPSERTCPELIQFVRPRKGWIVNEERSPNVKVCHLGEKYRILALRNENPPLNEISIYFVILPFRKKDLLSPWHSSALLFFLLVGKIMIFARADNFTISAFCAVYFRVTSFHVELSLWHKFFTACSPETEFCG